MVLYLGFTQCISIFYFLHSVNCSLRFVCNCFEYNLFTIVNMMFFSFSFSFFLNKVFITCKKRVPFCAAQLSSW